MSPTLATASTLLRSRTAHALSAEMGSAYASAHCCEFNEDFFCLIFSLTKANGQGPMPSTGRQWRPKSQNDLLEQNGEAFNAADPPIDHQNASLSRPMSHQVSRMKNWFINYFLFVHIIKLRLHC